MRYINTNFQKLILGALGLVIISSHALIFYTFYDIQKKNLHHMLQTQTDKVRYSFEQNSYLNLQEHYTKELNRLITPKLINGVRHNNRGEVVAALRELFGQLKRHDKYIEALLIHRNDGTALYRMHDQDSLNDHIAKTRPFLQHLHATQQTTYGYEVGKNGLFYRIAIPLFNGTHYLGAIEVGISLAKLLNTVANFNHLDGKLILHDTMLSQQYRQIALSDSKGALQHITTNNRIIHHDNNHHLVHAFEIIDFDDKLLGHYLFKQDISIYFERYIRTLTFVGIVLLLSSTLVFALIFWLFTYFAKRTRLLQERTHTILDAQQDIVGVTKNGNYLSESNRALLQFFNFNSLKEFRTVHTCICDTFLETPGYLHAKMGTLSWLEYILTHPQKVHLAQIKRLDKIHTFKVFVNRMTFYGLDKDEYVISLQDITQEVAIQEKLTLEQKLFSAGPVITIEWDPSHNWPIRYVSENVRDILGYSPHEMKAQGFIYAELIHPDDLVRVFNEVTHYIDTRTSGFEQSYRLRLKNGRYRWFFDFTHLVFDENDTLITIRGYMFDHTQLKESQELLQEQKERFETIFKAFPDATVLINPLTQQFEQFNTVAHTQLGYSSDEFSTKTIEDIDAVENPQFTQKRIQTIQEQGSDRFKTKHRKKDGTTIDVDVSVHILHANKQVYMFAVFRDITQQMKAQKELLELNEKLQRASQAKGEFLANMSHEIRTPMNAIIGLSQLILDTPLNAKQRDLIEKVHGASKMLLAIINDILDFSKLEAGKLELEYHEFELDSLFSQLHLLFAARATKSNLELYFHKAPDVPDAIVSDELRLSQVLSNLLSNALKFTSQGVVLLSISKTQNLSDHRVRLHFSVSDTGIGMSLAQQTRLFEPFSQADSSTTRQYGGTGLGLMISQKIIQALGSSIDVKTKQYHGSTFSFDIDVTVAKERNDFVLTPKKLKVLIVDDQEISRTILRDMLERFEYECHQAVDGNEAIKLIKASNDAPYDVILMDHEMPNLNGKDTIDTLKMMYQNGTLKHKAPTMIMVSAHLAKEIGIDSACIDAFLPKPVTASTLYDAIARTQEGGHEPRASKKSTELPDFNGAHILLVEDNEINQEVASMMLERVNTTITIAHNGKEATDLFEHKDNNFDLILMDLQMPIMSGYEATKVIRQSDKNIPIVALTAAAMVEDRQKVLHAGMNEHLGKPIDAQELYEILAQFLPHKKSQALIDEKNPSHTTTQTDDKDSIDTQALYASLSSQALAHKLLGKLLNQLQGEFSTLCQDIKDQDENAHKKVHSLKGVSGNLKALQLFEVCKTIDAHYKQNKAIDKTLIDKLQEAIHTTKETIKALLEKADNTNSSAPTIDETKLKPLIDEALSKLNNNQMLNTPMQTKLLNALKPTLDAQTFSTLQEALDELELDQAYEILKKEAL